MLNAVASWSQLVTWSSLLANQRRPVCGFRAKASQLLRRVTTDEIAASFIIHNELLVGL